MRHRKKRHDAPCVLFLEDAFGSGEYPDLLRGAGFEIRCFRDDFPAQPGKPEQSVKDPRIIRHCHENNYVLVTTDKQLCYTHIGRVKKTGIVVIATESNRSEMRVWVDALIKAKAKIDRLVKKTQKSGERPCAARLSRTGDVWCDKDYLKKTTRKHRPKEGQEPKE